MLVYASIVPESQYYDDEFHTCFDELKRAVKAGLAGQALKMSFRCCDNLYLRMTATTGRHFSLISCWSGI